jgi:hypothetical protein
MAEIRNDDESREVISKYKHEIVFENREISVQKINRGC